MAFTATPGAFTPINIFAMLRMMINNNVPILSISGVPVSGTSGSFAGQAGPGAILIDFLNSTIYMNIGTQASPSWSAIAHSLPVPITASGAINPHIPRTYVITKAGIAAMTLAAPTATVDDGAFLDITSDTAFAHTITFPAGILKNGGAAVTVFTFTGTTSGGGLSLVAYNGTWKALSSLGGAFS